MLNRLKRNVAVRLIPVAVHPSGDGEAVGGNGGKYAVQPRHNNIMRMLGAVSIQRLPAADNDRQRLVSEVNGLRGAGSGVGAKLHLAFACDRCLNPFSASMV